jgi:hypothetical protein
MRRFYYYVERNPLTVLSHVVVGGLVMSSVHGLAVETKGHADPALMQHKLHTSINRGDTKTVVDFSSVRHNKVGPMMGAYWGITTKQGKPAAVPSKLTVNWTSVLAELWGKKMQVDGVSPATQKSASGIVLKYASEAKDTKSVHQFITGANDTITITKASIDYPKLCNDFRISECDTFQKIANSITGEMLVAYGLTEIFPAHDGEYNVKALDVTLRNAGENYLNSIPALGDGLLSKGFYQFTYHAVCRGISCDGLGGVTKVDDYAGGKLAGSVLYLEGTDHHKAAFEFAVYNIAMLSRELSTQDMAQLAACPKDDLAAFIATAHHMPSRAVSNAKNWVKHKCAKAYTVYSGPHLTEYAIKTKLNYRAVQQYMKEELK